MESKINREFDNCVAMIHDLASKAEVWSSRPSWLEFATNNVCNLRCVMCGQSDGEPLSRMATDAAKTLLDDVLPHCSLVTPSANSEPLLGDIDLVVDACRSHDVYLNVYTNATVLDGARFRALADRVYKLHISLDSHIPEIFEKIRVRADHARIVDNVREILPIAQELGVPVTFVFVMMSVNTPHLSDFIDYVADLAGEGQGVQVRVQDMIYHASRCPELEVRAEFDENEICTFLDRAEERARARGVIFSVEAEPPFARTVTPVPPPVRNIGPDLLARFIETVRHRYFGFCSMATYYLKVKPDGSVFPCCRAPEELTMGNVHEATIEEIWNGENYRRFRRQMNTGDYPDVCRHCPVLGLETKEEVSTSS